MLFVLSNVPFWQELLFYYVNNKCFVITISWVGEITPNEISGCCVPALPSWFFHHMSKKIVVEIKAPGMWLGVGIGMLRVKYFCSNKACFCVCQM